MVDVRISGADQLRKLAAHIRRTGDKGLGRELGRALDKAIAPVKRAIEASAEQTVPSGYWPTLSRSLKHRRSLRTTTRIASVRLATYAAGEKERRDLPAINAGPLRHPVFGRVRRTRHGLKPNPWAVTRVKPGFHERGTRQAGPGAEKQLLVVLDDLADRLAKG